MKCSRCDSNGAVEIEEVMKLSMVELPEDAISNRTRINWLNKSHKRDRTFDRANPSGNLLRVAWEPEMLCRQCINFFSKWLSA